MKYTDPEPSTGQLKEAARELLRLSRSLRPSDTAVSHSSSVQRALIALVPPRFFLDAINPDLIDQVVEEEGGVL